jgi:hypothetical protein
MPMLADCSPKGLECTEFSFYQHITPAQFGDPIQDDSEEDQQLQPVLQKRIAYVSKLSIGSRLPGDSSTMHQKVVPEYGSYY